MASWDRAHPQQAAADPKLEGVDAPQLHCQQGGPREAVEMGQLGGLMKLTEGWAKPCTWKE